VRAWAEAVAGGLGADRPATLRLVLILEELFTNTVVHGYPVGADGPIWVTLAGGAGVIEVTYEDAGLPFDPITERQVSRLDEVPGGLGLALVRGLSTGACYARIGERNRITLGVSFGGTPPGGTG
jgi:anti-sigma regulatory factor (Ser/Thr protein kinase)